MLPGGVSSNVMSEWITSGVAGLFWLLLIAVTIVALWKIFEKAGQPGWKSLIPVYNVVILCRIANLSGWCAILYAIPGVNIIITIIVAIRIAKAFGRSGLFAVGVILIPAIFLIILGFDKSAYLGPYYGGQAGSSETPATSVPAQPSSASPIDTTATFAPQDNGPIIS